MDWRWYLSAASDLAQVVICVLLVGAGALYFWSKRSRRVRLERHLETLRRNAEARGGRGNGARGVTELMGACLMTEAQILEAAFSSVKIASWAAVDEETGRAGSLQFRISERAWRKIKSAK
jgi:hypothetical protein